MSEGWGGKVTAPFTIDQVASLNAYQDSGIFHEFTCGNETCKGILVACQRGWYCPLCGYAQYWAHGAMADWSWQQVTAREAARSWRARGRT